MEEGLPEEETPQSREGQLLHDYCAHPEYNRRVLTSQQQDLLSLADELTNQAIETVRITLPDQTIIEEWRERQIHGIISGTPDLVLLYETAPLIIDRKFGYNVVDRADLNLQLRSYAVIVWESYKVQKSEKVFVSIIQPRLWFGERVTIAEYLPEDIEASKAEISRILDKSNHDRARLIPGEEQCRYCKAKLICPAFREAMTVPAVITPDKILSKRAREAFLEQRLAECSDDELERVIKACKLADFANDLALDEARKRIRDGRYQNYVLGKPIEVRNITDVRRAIALLSLGGLTKSEIFDCVHEFSLTSLVETLRKKNKSWTEKEANEYINKKLRTVITTVTRKPRILAK